MNKEERVKAFIKKDVASYADLIEFLSRDGTEILFAESDGVLIKERGGVFVVCAETEACAEKIFSLPTAPKMEIVARIGTLSGRMMRSQTLRVDAPSITALSSSEEGMDSM